MTKVHTSSRIGRAMPARARPGRSLALELAAERRARCLAEAALQARERRFEVHVEQQAAVVALGLAALGDASMEALLTQAGELAARCVGVRFSHVLEYEAATGCFRLRAGVGWRPGLVGLHTFVGDGTQAAAALAAGQPIVTADLEGGHGFHLPGFLKEHGVRTGLCVPIRARGVAYGVLAVDHDAPLAFDPSDVGFVQSLANILAEAIDRKRATAERDRLVGIVEASPDFIGISTVDGQVLYRNAAARRLLGITGTTEPGRERIVQSYPDHAARRLRDEILPAARRDGIWRGDNVLLAADGREIPVAQTFLGHFGPDGELRHFSVVMRDVSTERRLEEQLRQAGKLEAIGQLTGGVAHDFNNVLSVILAGATFLLDDLDAGDPRRGDAQEIKDAAQRAAVLTRHLLAFARKQVFDARLLDLGDLILGLVPRLRREAGDAVALVCDLDPGRGLVLVDAGQIEQVVLSLARNARDAMPDGGELRISVANASLDPDDRLRDPDVIAGDYVRLTVADTGCGMDASTRRHLFEPFFSTKPVGQGTGMGLATCYGIVRQSGGVIWVDSDPGAGTCVVVHLPRRAVPAPADPAFPAAGPAPPGMSPP